MREPPGFWTFFFAVVAALLAHDLIRLGVAAVGLSVAFGALTSNPFTGTSPGHLPAAERAHHQPGARSAAALAGADNGVP